MRLADGIISPIALEPHDATPLYIQLYKGLREAIVSGEISAGTRLPSTRGLAEDLDVSRTTAIQAYRQLELEGYVDTAIGSGTYVSDELPDRVVAVGDELLRMDGEHGANGSPGPDFEAWQPVNGRLGNGHLRSNGSAHAEGRGRATGSAHHNGNGASQTGSQAERGPFSDGGIHAGPVPALDGGRHTSGAKILDQRRSRRGTSRAPHALHVPDLSARGRRIVDNASENGHGHGVMPFLPGIPALDKFPYRTWRRVEREVRSPTSELGPGDPSGDLRLREAIARHVAATRAVHCHPDQVVITAGANEAFSILAELLFDPGDEVVMEDPGYRSMASGFEALGARIVPVRVDGRGMDVQLATLRAPDARLVCVTPSNQFPMGVLLSMERRKLLVEWARARGAWIIEDDYDCEYRFHGAPYPAIRSLEGADECTVYVSTFTRILFPALSLGFVILPRDLVEPYKAARSLRDDPPPLLPQLTLAKFMEEGHLLRHIRHMRHIYEDRAGSLREALTNVLPRTVDVPPASAGMHLVAWLPEGMDDRELSDRAATKGILPLPVSLFRHTPSPRGGLILGFGGSPSARLIRSAKKLSHAFA